MLTPLPPGDPRTFVAYRELLRRADDARRELDRCRAEAFARLMAQPKASVTATDRVVDRHPDVVELRRRADELAADVKAAATAERAGCLADYLEAIGAVS